VSTKCFDILGRYHKNGDEFLSHIVTDDEIVNVEAKEQSKQWM
jgi:hypothetical protein